MFLVTAGTVALALLPTGPKLYGQPPANSAVAEDDSPATAYEKGTLADLNDPVARLQKRIYAGTARLKYDGTYGYLPAVLDALGVSPTSQILVFSKTSFQHQRISPRTPRALYFNDSAFVGYVQQGDVLEFMATDPRFGTVFYTLSQTPKARPRFERQTLACTQCHHSSATRNVPGYMFRSVFPGLDGTPKLNMGSALVRPETPFGDRWGGWYVSGKHGAERHRGNSFVRGGENYDEFDKESGANQTDLSPYFDTTAYPTPHSDIVALMIAEHQGHLLNLLSEANWGARDAERMDRIIHPDLKPGELSESTQGRLGRMAETLTRALLCADETPLKEAISGTSGFAGRFSALGPRDSKGRSLRELDLKRRLFRYPCSYLIYSPAFDGLPTALKSAVYRRLRHVLTAPTPEPGYDHLSAEDRQAVYEILIATKPAFGKP